VTAPTTAARIIEQLGLRGGDVYWAQALEAVGAPSFTVKLPPAVEAGAELARLGVADADARDVVATLPSPESAPELWWLLERAVHRLVNETARPEEWHIGWPDWTARHASRSLAERCFMAHVYLATLPHTRRWHAEHDIPPAVSEASFADLGRHMAIHRRAFGATGIDNAWWLTLSLRAEVYDLGRLQFTNFVLGGGDQHVWWYPDSEVAARGAGFQFGDSCIGVHIPEPGPLSPQACDDAFTQAADFFPRYFPMPAGQNRRIATCWSWLLDDQLADILPAGSNIVAFQRRFELVPGWTDGDHSVAEFVWRRRLPADGPTEEWLDSVPSESRLQKALIAHWREGGHYRSRTGWLDL
jgi:hypothetical protein